MILGNPLLNIVEIASMMHIFSANLATDMVDITMVFPLDSECIEIVWGLSKH